MRQLPCIRASCSFAALRRELRFISNSIRKNGSCIGNPMGWQKPVRSFAMFLCSATAKF